MEINLNCSALNCKNKNHINGLCLHHFGFIKYNKFMKSWGNAKSSDGYCIGSFNGKYVKVHRLVMEAFTNKKVDDDMDVHHINSNKNDNRIENLQLLTKNEHRKIHALEMTKIKPGVGTKLCLECKIEKPLYKFKITEYSKLTRLAKRKGRCQECRPSKSRDKISSKDRCKLQP